MDWLRIWTSVKDNPSSDTVVYTFYCIQYSLKYYRYVDLCTIIENKLKCLKNNIRWGNQLEFWQLEFILFIHINCLIYFKCIFAYKYNKY